jgi:predicted GIY-YIG superfamily endonuclease
MRGARKDVPGVVYLLHFEQPYKHAKHYLGWSEDLDSRIAAHDAGKGSNLVAVVAAAGIAWTIARTWNGTRARERQLKKQGGASRFCPVCKGRAPMIDHRDRADATSRRAA